jgi:hypothetical protein
MGHSPAWQDDGSLSPFSAPAAAQTKRSKAQDVCRGSEADLRGSEGTLDEAEGARREKVSGATEAG